MSKTVSTVHQVYDRRIKEALFESDKHIECLDYLLDNVDETNLPHTYVRTIERGA